MFYYIILFNLILVKSYNPFFNHWHCLGFKNDIDFSRPYVVNIGDLPLVVWSDSNKKDDKKDNKLYSAINICPHMGSKLDNGKITDNGCLQCQYHGFNLTDNNQFGQIMEYQGKIHWSYKPKFVLPCNIPFYNNLKYAKSTIQIDMDSSLQDCALNTMDIRHPEYVHSGIFGFGSAQYPANIKQYDFNNLIGLEFEYTSNKIIQQFNQAKKTHNYHLYNYPSFTWSKVSFNNNNLIISVDFLPLSKFKTRWFVTICHNYCNDENGAMLINKLAWKILLDDCRQMRNQSPDTELKKELLLNHIFKDEEAIISLKNKFSEYVYPDHNEILKLYKHHKTSNNLLKLKQAKEPTLDEIFELFQ